MYLTPKEVVDQYVVSGLNRAKMPVSIIIAKSILAGMMIAMGAACSNVAAHSIENVGVARLIAGIVFPVGLMMVILLGAELFTGDCLMAMTVADRKVSVFGFIRFLCLVYLGNLIGGIILAVLVYMSGQFNYSAGRLGAYTIKVALGKVMLTPMQGITSGILCNILVCGAVLMAICAKDVTGKLMVSFFVVIPFVTGGFEHCVANMYYITAGLLAKGNLNYVEMASTIYGLTDLHALNIYGMVLKNLVPVTIGNIIGGSFFVGLPIYWINKNRK